MYDNTNASPTNRVTLTGRISSEPRYSHEIYGEAFYEFSLEVKTTERHGGHAARREERRLCYAR